MGNLFQSVALGSGIATAIVGLIAYAAGARGAGLRWALLIAAIVGGLYGYWSNSSNSSAIGATVTETTLKNVPDDATIQDWAQKAAPASSPAPARTAAEGASEQGKPWVPDESAPTDQGTPWVPDSYTMGSGNPRPWVFVGPPPNQYNNLTPAELQHRLTPSPAIRKEIKEVDRLRLLGK